MMVKNSFFFFIIFLFCANTCYSSVEDSLKGLVERAEGLEKMKLLKPYVIALSNVKDDSTASLVYEEATNFYKSCDLKNVKCDSIAHFYYVLSYNYSWRIIRGLRKDPLKAEKLLEDLIPEMEERKNWDLLADYNIGLGIMKRKRASYIDALVYYHKSLDLFIKLEDFNGQANVLHNIGNVFTDQKRYDEALEYHYKALSVRNEHNLTKSIQISWTTICGIHSHADNVDSTIHYLGLLLESDETAPDTYVAIAYSNVGIVLANADRYDEAIPYYYKAIELRNKIGYEFDIYNSKVNLGSVLMNSGDRSHTESLCLEGYNFARDNEVLSISMNACACLHKYYEEEAKYSKAYSFHKEYIKYRDSSDNTAEATEIVQTQMNYEHSKQLFKDSLLFAEKEAIHKSNLEKEQAITAQQNSEIEQEKTLKIALYGGIILIILFLGFVVNRLRISGIQKREIANQRDEIAETHLELEERNTEITDSIKYAERLQLAILPRTDDLKSYLGEGFVLFQPKDVVSGDFYWMQRTENETLFAVADCTGHGVPGAMVSVVCSNALNRSVKEFGLVEPSEILDKTRELVIETFARSGKDVKDGMDIALCSKRKDKIVFSGANNPLWIVRKSEFLTEDQKEERSTVEGTEFSLIEIKSNKQPVGLYSAMKDFNQTEVDLMVGDTYYMFTDGFADQFGGERGKKFKYKPFKKYLIEINNLEMDSQKSAIQDTFNTWKGDIEQVDDVCIIGVRFNLVQ